MIYKVSGKLHLWGWSDFCKAINGRVLEYKNEDNIILWKIFHVNEPIKKSLLIKYGLEAELIDIDENNLIRAKIIDILHKEHIRLPKNEVYYLKNRYGDTISFSGEKEIDLLYNNYFRIFMHHKKIYAECIGEHTINTDWLNKLNKTIKLRDILEKELEDIL